MEKAYLALGCFWGPEDFFSRVAGVIATQVGYSGGTTKNPTYENLGDHTETVEVTFDPKIISYQEILELFFEQHNPTLDHKAQYRSAIFYVDEERREIAEKAKADVEKKIGRKVVTSIEPLAEFYPAEEYHQKYIQKSGRGGVC